MKKFLTILILVLTFLPVFAQLSQLKIIGKPKSQPSEIIGLRDSNGRFCAGIMVVSDLDGFAYDAYNGVEKVDDKPGKDLVFLQPDERVLEIFKTGYEPLKIILSEIGISLRPKETWEIKIQGESNSSEVLPVTILVEPKGASISIDGKNQGAEIQHKLSLGNHNLKISKSGFEPISKTILIDENNTLFQFTLKEVQDVTLQLTSEPKGATVYIDGVKFGKTPLSDFYPSGKYSIKIEKDLYVTYEDFIEINPPQTVRNYELLGDFATLTIKTLEGATVYLNNQKITQLNEIKLEPQILRIRAEKPPKGKPKEERVILKKGDKITIEVFPEIPLGTLQIAVVPFEAKVELKGDEGEFYTSEGSKIFKDIPVGTYTFTVKAEGYSTDKQTIKVEENLTTKIKSQLIKKTSKSMYNIGTKDDNDELIPFKTITEKPKVVGFENEKFGLAVNKAIAKNLIYPDIARQASIEGKVIIQFDINKSGIPINFRVYSDPTEGILGNPALEAAKKLRFHPAIVDGKKVGLSSVTTPITFRLNSAPKPLRRMVFVRGGTFQMGLSKDNSDENEEPVHAVELSNFYISKLEVTQKEYSEIMGQNPSYFQGENKPVENISWYDAVKFCNAKSKIEDRTPCYQINDNKVTCDFSANGYRLPTEAEWEFAAKGGNKTKNYKFSGSNNLDKVGWNGFKETMGRTQETGKKEANELGIFDMSGNVAEWCNDWYEPYSSLNQRNPKGGNDSTTRIIRGGSWNMLSLFCSVTNRGNLAPSSSFKDIGFRLVITE